MDMPQGMMTQSSSRMQLEQMQRQQIPSRAQLEKMVQHQAGYGGDYMTGRGGGSTTGQGVSSAAQSIGLGMMAAGQAVPGPMGAFLSMITGVPVNAISKGLNFAGQATVDGQMAAMSAAADAMAAGNAASVAVPGIVTVSDMDGNIHTVSNDASIAAADAAMFGGDQGGSVADGDSDSSVGSGDNAEGGSYMGGPITRAMLKGPNPPGPDDGYRALDVGEYVIKASTAKKLGAPALKALNEGRAKIVID